ncbi:MAG: hypothetical protein HKN26_15035 [Acidimicrobiales bacterium]|nr:hypothetical protein [Acidimicrobiales bacterium]
MSSTPTNTGPRTGLLARVDQLAERLRSQPNPDPAAEAELVVLRNEAFGELAERAQASAGELPTVTDVSPPAASITAEDLVLTDRSASGLRRAFLTYGAALLPQAIDRATVTTLVEGIDHAFEAFDASRSGNRQPEHQQWFVPFDPPGFDAEAKLRGWNRSGGGIWTTDSPRNHFLLLETLRTAGVVQLITDYFGERPALSVDKSTLRRVPHDARTGDWHQDGAFMGKGIRTVNVWLALTDCGVTAPGLDIVPRAMDLAETGTEGAHFDWAVGPGVVEKVAPPVEVLRPEFRAGDILLFDHLFLHRTGAEAETMVNDRYAIETWFFAPSCYPDTQLPIVV